MATIGLCMIVKNEAKLILRCLNSVRPLVDFVLISDTGSSDGTQKIIRDWLEFHGVEGLVTEDAWQDFASNRTTALHHLRKIKSIDYAFVIDADDQLEITPGLDIAGFKAQMDVDIYDLMVRHAGVVHPRPQIFRNKPGFHYVGVLHEFLEAPKPFTRSGALGLVIKASIEGSRNADPQKWLKDAQILKKAIKSEKNAYMRARYMFYLAQSYRDAEDFEQALKYYLIRSNTAGGWDQEIYISLLEAIRCYTKLGSDHYQKAYYTWQRASAMMPQRAEADHAMSFFCRQVGKNHEGMDIARRGLSLAVPDGLFVEPWIYEYALRDEFSVNAYWSGHYLEGLKGSLVLLASEKTPHSMVVRLANNSIACVEKLTPKFVSNTSLVFSD
jgi:glycosyltransferase involved in cell wall biosynthesis